MATNARGQTTLDGTPVTRASIESLLMQANDVRGVTNLTARAQLVADLTAAGFPPSASRPLYVDRADAPANARLERTVDGVEWETIFSEVGRSYLSDAAGGGNLTTVWTAASAPARVTLPPGVYLVAASETFTVSASSYVSLSSHLFSAGGSAIGAGQESVTAVQVTGQTASRTMDFTRLVTLAAPTTLEIRSRTSATGGVQSRGGQHLAAVRVA